MSVTTSHHTAPPRPSAPRRVRQEVRDVLAVVAFSAGASVALTVALTLLVMLAG